MCPLLEVSVLFEGLPLREPSHALSDERATTYDARSNEQTGARKLSPPLRIRWLKLRRLRAEHRVGNELERRCCLLAD